jgi:hypothetical protein
MSDTLAHLPSFLQDLFVQYPEDLNGELGCCQRRRKFTPSSLVRTLVFGWLDDPKASVDKLAGYAACLGPTVSGSALRQRLLAPACVALLREVLDHALQPLLFGRPSPLPLLQRFNGVYLFDSSSLALPACLSNEERPNSVRPNFCYGRQN